MDFSNSAQALRDIIAGKKFVIPMYQRNYKWDTSVAVKLAEDIIGCYQESKNIPQIKKSVGLLTLYNGQNEQNQQNKAYYVIDGQQRFTTLTIVLAVLGSKENIDISFERDEPGCPKRHNAILEECKIECTDVNRINRNKTAINDVIKGFNADEKEEIAEFILNNVIMLCSVVRELPVGEFMNLNAYKTAFSISDHIRANLISLNSFYKEEMSSDENGAIIAGCLSKNTYKTAVAVLYNNIQEKLYHPIEVEGKYKSIYDLLKEPKEKVIDPQMESRINIIFSGMLKEGAANYDVGEITESFDYWMKMLQKLAYVNKLLDELESELLAGEFHSFKQIDDYQKITKKSFIAEVFEEFNRLDRGWDSQTLAKEIQRYSNVNSVLIRCLNQDSKKLANRYLEAFVYSDINEETIKKADNENRKKVKLPQMSMDEVIEEIAGCGRYMIDRYEKEHREDLNTIITIPPVIDLEDRENINFGGNLEDTEDGTDLITIGALFRHDIIIPVIQRDYCMGARIIGENDFLAYLMKGFNDKKNEPLIASTILISVSNNNDKKIYIFDGQQRTFTLYNILRFCNMDTADLKSYSFVGRTDRRKGDKTAVECGSPYSEQAVENLNKILKERIKESEKQAFAAYIKNHVKLKVKIVNDVSGAEQFFMDINGGVALKKYEIYKAMLCARLSSSDVERPDIVRKIENEWLDFFYKYRENYLKVSNINTDESDEEELIEIRFIEFICRFVYRMNRFGAKNFIGPPEKLLSFDEIESKGEMTAKLNYINKLSKADIDEIDKIMNRIMKAAGKDDSAGSAVIELDELKLLTNSSGGMVSICRLRPESWGTENDYYITRFIWSLADKNREILKKYYRYKDVGGLIKIYDEDQILGDILLNVLGGCMQEDIHQYQPSDDSTENVFYGGYRNRKDNGSFGVAEMKMQGRCVKEIPAYYYNKWNISDRKIVRLQYLQEKADAVKDAEVAGFALVKNSMKHQIMFEDGEGSNICPVKNLDGYECTNRTEAYCLAYIWDYVING